MLHSLMVGAVDNFEARPMESDKVSASPGISKAPVVLDGLQ